MLFRSSYAHFPRSQLSGSRFLNLYLVLFPSCSVRNITDDAVLNELLK